MVTAQETTNDIQPQIDQRRFGVMIYPDKPVDELIERVQWIEQLGFDQVFLPDHSGDFRNMAGWWLDGTSILAALAVKTTSIRIGTLVSNPILREPSLLAKQAMTIDHLAQGRFDLGIGAGVFEFDHLAMGSEPWSPRERAGRFAEYVEIVDGILRGNGPPYSFAGTWLKVSDVPTAPGPVQQPRVPIIVGGQSPTVLRTAAKFADTWNTIGPMGLSAEEILDVTARQNRQLDELAIAAGRDPKQIRRSIASFGPFDIWETPIGLNDLVAQFSPIGMNEFVFDLPPDDRLTEFEHLANVVIPGLRQS